jgi:hypothetical protein
MHALLMYALVICQHMPSPLHPDHALACLLWAFMGFMGFYGLLWAFMGFYGLLWVFG